MATAPTHPPTRALQRPTLPGANGSHAPGGTGDGVVAAKDVLFDLSAIDLAKRILTREDLEKVNPHRGDMALLDAIVWHTPDFSMGVGLKHTRGDEFWVKGHFPGKAMFPGVLMIEAAAQVAVYLYNARVSEPMIAAFTRIEHAVFRQAVVPGDDLYILCKEIKWSRRGFTCDVQGLINAQRMAFEARVQGLALQGTQLI